MCKVSGYFCFRGSVSLRVFDVEECMIYQVKCPSGTINFKSKSENNLCLMACDKEAQDVIVKHICLTSVTRAKPKDKMEFPA